MKEFGFYMLFLLLIVLLMGLVVLAIERGWIGALF